MFKRIKSFGRAETRWSVLRAFRSDLDASSRTKKLLANDTKEQKTFNDRLKYLYLVMSIVFLQTF